jgi:hypothetical protein
MIFFSRCDQLLALVPMIKRADVSDRKRALDVPVALAVRVEVRS